MDTTHPPGPRPSAFRGAAATAALRKLGPSPLAGLRFALLTHCTAKPVAFESLAALARAIHRRRQGQPIQLRPHALGLPGDARTRLVTAVYLQDEASSVTGFLGYAWHDGGGWEQLAAALLAAAPPEPCHGGGLRWGRAA